MPSKSALYILNIPTIDWSETSGEWRPHPRFDCLDVILSLQLPLLHEFCYEISLACESNPNPFGEKYSELNGHNLKKYTNSAAHMSNPEDAIVAAMFHVCSEWCIEDQITIVLHRRTILRLVSQHKLIPSRNRDVRILPSVEQCENDTNT